MFFGEHEHSLDSKGRVIVPAKFRDELEGSVFLCAGLDKCLYGFTTEGSITFNENIKKLPMSPEGRKMRRFYSRNSQMLDIDKQGRILVPQKLRDLIGIKKDVVFVGFEDRFELWSKEELDKLDDMDDIDSIAQSLTEQGFTL